LPLLLNTADTGGAPPQAPSTGSEANEERLRRLYNLTRSEARLAEMLASGFALPAAARQLGVGQNTVRTHLQRIYSKTDTHHQSGLVALLLTGPAHLQVEYHSEDDDPSSPDGADASRYRDARGEPLARAKAAGKRSDLPG
jgi:DNA-binding CsgD family transcriptional regulator